MSEPITIRLWAGRVPFAESDDAEDTPTLTIYRPAVPPRGAIVVCPGGGYGAHADHENEPVCRWLNSLGILAASLKYRLAPRRHPAMITDANRAIRFVRHHAADWQVPANDAGLPRVGILGFSAGGHLSATAATQFSPHAEPRDAIDRLNARPDIAVLLYPVITLLPPHAHLGSRWNLLGNDASDALAESMSADRNVTAATPPTFIFHTSDDAGVPVENAYLFAAAARRAGVPCELHSFETGQHGVGLATDDPRLSQWPALCASWLKTKGF